MRPASHVTVLVSVNVVGFCIKSEQQYRLAVRDKQRHVHGNIDVNAYVTVMTTATIVWPGSPPPGVWECCVHVLRRLCMYWFCCWCWVSLYHNLCHEWICEPYYFWHRCLSVLLLDNCPSLYSLPCCWSYYLPAHVCVCLIWFLLIWFQFNCRLNSIIMFIEIIAIYLNLITDDWIICSFCFLNDLNDYTYNCLNRIQFNSNLMPQACYGILKRQHIRKIKRFILFIRKFIYSGGIINVQCKTCKFNQMNLFIYFFIKCNMHGNI